MRLRMSRNAGNESMRWMLTQPTSPHTKILYASAVLMENVEFEVRNKDGWAVGDVKCVVDPVHGAGPKFAIATQAVLDLENDRIAGLDTAGWEPLRYEKRRGFVFRGQVVPGVRALLVAAGVCLAR